MCIGHLTDKMGDVKLKKPAGDTMIAFAEKTSLSFVLSQGTVLSRFTNKDGRHLSF